MTGIPTISMHTQNQSSWAQFSLARVILQSLFSQSSTSSNLGQLCLGLLLQLELLDELHAAGAHIHHAARHDAGGR